MNQDIWWTPPIVRCYYRQLLIGGSSNETTVFRFGIETIASACLPSSHPTSDAELDRHDHTYLGCYGVYLKRNRNEPAWRHGTDFIDTQVNIPIFLSYHSIGSGTIRHDSNNHIERTVLHIYHPLQRFVWLTMPFLSIVVQKLCSNAWNVHRTTVHILNFTTMKVTSFFLTHNYSLLLTTQPNLTSSLQIFNTWMNTILYPSVICWSVPRAETFAAIPAKQWPGQLFCFMTFLCYSFKAGVHQDFEGHARLDLESRQVFPLVKMNSSMLSCPSFLIHPWFISSNVSWERTQLFHSHKELLNHNTWPQHHLWCDSCFSIFSRNLIITKKYPGSRLMKQLCLRVYLCGIWLNYSFPSRHLSRGKDENQKSYQS